VFFRHKIWHTTDGTGSWNQYYKIHKRFRNYPSSSFTRLHNLTLCHFHKYRDLSNGVVTCHASPCLAPPPSPSPVFLLNTFFYLRSTLESICRPNSRRRGSSLNSIYRPNPTFCAGGERAFFPGKSPPPPPLQHVMC